MRLTAAGSWSFSTANSAGTYYLWLDAANNFLLGGTQNTAYLTVATVHWDGSSVLSSLALNTLALSTGYQSTGVAGGGGSGNMQTSVYDPRQTGSVLLAQGINDENGNAATAAQIVTAISEEHTHANKALLDEIISTLTGVLKIVSGAVQGGAQAADVGAIALAMLSTAIDMGQSAGPSNSLVPSQAAVYTFVENVVSGITGGYSIKGLWNADREYAGAGEQHGDGGVVFTKWARRGIPR